jgi:hypothetical protein
MGEIPHFVIDPEHRLTVPDMGGEGGAMFEKIQHYQGACDFGVVVAARVVLPLVPELISSGLFGQGPSEKVWSEQLKSP